MSDERPETRLWFMIDQMADVLYKAAMRAEALSKLLIERGVISEEELFATGAWVKMETNRKSRLTGQGSFSLYCAEVYWTGEFEANVGRDNERHRRWRTLMINQARRIVAVALGIALAVTLVAVRADAQSDETRTFGTSSEVSYTVPAISFTEFALTNNNTSQAYSSTVDGARFCTLINCRLLAPVQLPAGARVTRIEVDGCDTNPGAGLNFGVILHRARAHEAGTTQLASATSAGAPGCVFVTGTLATPETIDNRNNTYFLDYIDGGTNDGTLRFTAVRIFYTLQVSPAPAVATFADVPTNHIFFPFIEALVAAGITSGCNTSPPMFCPDNVVTRGQMAKFISEALGLQFAP